MKLLTYEQRQDIIERMQARSNRLYPGFEPPPALLACHPDCEYCQGKGWFVDARRPNERDAAHPCPNIGKGSDHFRVTWNSINPVGSVMRAIKAVKDTLAAGSGWVYLYGPPGRAKTMILKAVKNDPASGLGVVYTDMLKIMDNLRGAFDFEAGQAELKRRQEHWIRVPVLLIDEFDRFKQSEFAVERLYAIMDARYEGALVGKSVTIMASNAAPTDYEPYLRSRLEDGRNAIVKLDGADMRPGARR